MTTAEIEALSVDMLPVACRLVEAVHADDVESSHEILLSLGVMPLRTLSVVLASLIPVGDVALRSLDRVFASSSPRMEG